MSRQPSLTFITDSGGEQTITMQDYDRESQLEYYNTPFDEAIDGSLRQNVRGERLLFSIRYKLCGDPDRFRSICNNIAQDFRNGKEFIRLGLDSDRVFRVVLDGDLAYKIEYAEQHGQFIPRLSFKAAELGGLEDVDIEFQDWGLITELVDEQRDYGLITEAVDTQIDYGFIG